MSDGTNFGHEEFDPMLEALRNAVFYRDLDTAAETFALLEAAGLVLDFLREGTELDRERLGRLVEIIDPKPWLEVVYDEDGSKIYYDENDVEVRREAPDPEMQAYLEKEKARKRSTEEFIASRAPTYLESILSQLANPEESKATLKVLVRRGQKEGSMNLNTLELAALNSVRDELRARGFVVTEGHIRAGDDGSEDHAKPQLTHTLHTLVVTPASPIENE